MTRCNALSDERYTVKVTTHTNIMYYAEEKHKHVPNVHFSIGRCGIEELEYQCFKCEISLNCVANLS